MSKDNIKENKMKKIHKFSSGFLLVFCLISSINTTFAMTPPDYLRVNHWQLCLGEKKVDTYIIVCLPKKHPNDCPATSWTELQSMSDLPRCDKPI